MEVFKSLKGPAVELNLRCPKTHPLPGLQSTFPQRDQSHDGHLRRGTTQDWHNSQHIPQHPAWTGRVKRTRLWTTGSPAVKPPALATTAKVLYTHGLTESLELTQGPSELPSSSQSQTAAKSSLAFAFGTTINLYHYQCPQGEIYALHRAGVMFTTCNSLPSSLPLGRAPNTKQTQCWSQEHGERTEA